MIHAPATRIGSIALLAFSSALILGTACESEGGDTSVPDSSSSGGGGGGAAASSGTGGLPVGGAGGSQAGGAGGGPIGCAPDPTSATVVDVRDSPYNAQGDGVTDDTAALQLAVDAVAGTGGTVRIPAGTYMVDAETKIRLKSVMTLRLDPDATLKDSRWNNRRYPRDRVRSTPASTCAVTGEFSNAVM